MSVSFNYACINVFHISYSSGQKQNKVLDFSFLFRNSRLVDNMEKFVEMMDLMSLYIRRKLGCKTIIDMENLNFWWYQRTIMMLQFNQYMSLVDDVRSTTEMEITVSNKHRQYYLSQMIFDLDSSYCYKFTL